MPKISYHTDGQGYWSKREWAEQCDNTGIFLSHRCQGIKGHKGVHWCYSPCGSFEWVDNENDSTENGCAGSTPPGHSAYKSPVDMQPLHWLSSYTDTWIIDPAKIAALERDEIEEGASVTRPVTRSIAESLEEFAEDLKHESITAKEYKTGKIHPPRACGRRLHVEAIENNAEYMAWVATRVAQMSSVWKDNRKAFTAIFGPPDWHYNSEFRFHVWMMEYEDEEFIVLTARGKGTCIEIVGGVCNKGSKIIAFVQYLANKLEAVNA